MIPLSKPDITQSEVDAVTKVLRSGVLSLGPAAEEFERKIADYIGVKCAVAVNSGTSGLHLLVKAFGIGEGDEVITTPFSFVSSANCIIYEKAVPVFADIDPETLELDLDRIEEKITGRTKAILPVDIFGQPMDIGRIRTIADKYGLVIIEDSCEALGSEYKGIKAGRNADGAVYAFYPNKQITTGEGGMIVTNYENPASLCRSMRNQGRGESGLWLRHERLGFNYRMSELHAALGLAQFERLEEILGKREHAAALYNEKLKSVHGIRLPFIKPDVTRMSWFVYVVRFEEGIDRDAVMHYLIEKGIGCRPYFSPIHLQPYFIDRFGCRPGDFPITEKVSESTLALPMYGNLSENEADIVTAVLQEGINKALLR